jgi:hypothetical protein
MELENNLKKDRVVLPYSSAEWSLQLLLPGEMLEHAWYHGVVFLGPGAEHPTLGLARPSLSAASPIILFRLGGEVHPPWEG